MTDDNTENLKTLEKQKKAEKQEKRKRQKLRKNKKALKKKMKKQPLPRKDRLIIAKKWLEEYDIAVQGKNIIKKYRKHFHVEPMCAFEEIQMLGYPLTDEQIPKFHEVERNKVIQEKNRKIKRRLKREVNKKSKENIHDMFPDSDDTFCMIMGYTSGGAPYGVTWEEMDIELLNLFMDED